VSAPTIKYTGRRARPLHLGCAMTWNERWLMTAALLCCAVNVAAQTPAKEPPPVWDVQIGAAFVGTSGNADTSTIGADFGAHRRWTVWQIESAATAIRATDRGTRTAERYLASFRGDRALVPRIGLSAGERAERDRLAGIDLRSITDVGLKYALMRQTQWTLDGLTALALNHESSIADVDRNDPIAVLQAVSKYTFNPSSDTVQRFTFYPDFKQSSAYRAEAEVTAQAALNSRLALKLGYLWRYSNAPIAGFMKSDNTATASVVVGWKAVTAAASAP
jgi:putative salt-induced outer membrane protein YdiY